MKKLKNCFWTLLLLLVTSCGDDLMNEVPLIEINPGFAQSGLTSAAVVSLNESQTIAMTYSRVYGISRELTMNLTVDGASLSAYNQSNGTDYQLLPAEYYQMPATTSFASNSKDASFSVTLNPKKLYEFAGSVTAASKYVLPIKAESTQAKGVDVDAEKNLVLLRVNMSPVTVKVNVPSKPINLDFVQDSGSEEDVAITATSNFAALNKDNFSVVIDENAPLLSEEGYKLLPATNYDFSNVTIDGSGNLSYNGAINGNDLSDEFTYVLPCRLQTSNPHYVISQSDVVYYQANITELKVSVTGASATKAVGAYTSLATVNGSVEVALNSLVPIDITANFVYDPSLIADYNSRNGESFLTLPAGTVTIKNAVVPKGQKSFKIPYTIDISSLKLADGKHYLVPLVMQTSKIELGGIQGSEVIYFDVTRTLVGEYELTKIDNERPRNVRNTIFEASKCQRAAEKGWDKVIANGAQYGFGGDGDFYAVLFSVTDEDMPGKANCKKIEIYTFLELLIATGGSNDVKNNNSYFDTVTGEVYIDCSVYEQWVDKFFKETYSFKRK